MERRLPNIFNYLRTFPLKQFATLNHGVHFKNLAKTGHAISEFTGHDIFEMTGHNAEINGHDGLKYAASWLRYRPILNFQVIDAAKLTSVISDEHYGET